MILMNVIFDHCIRKGQHLEDCITQGTNNFPNHQSVGSNRAGVGDPLEQQTRSTDNNITQQEKIRDVV